jgi:ribonuclease P protein subunit POP4
MPYNNKNIVVSELIGLHVRISAATDRNQAGLCGTVIDETKNTLLLDTENGIKSIIKKNSVFKFYADERSFTVNGDEINFRSHERIERSMRFYRSRKV